MKWYGSNLDFWVFWGFSRPWPEKPELTIPFLIQPDPKIVWSSRPWPEKPKFGKLFKALSRKNLTFVLKVPGWRKIWVRSPHKSTKWFRLKVLDQRKGRCHLLLDLIISTFSMFYYNYCHFMSLKHSNFQLHILRV